MEAERLTVAVRIRAAPRPSHDLADRGGRGSRWFAPARSEPRHAGSMPNRRPKVDAARHDQERDSVRDPFGTLGRRRLPTSGDKTQRRASARNPVADCFHGAEPRLIALR